MSITHESSDGLPFDFKGVRSVSPAEVVDLDIPDFGSRMDSLDGLSTDIRTVTRQPTPPLFKIRLVPCRCKVRFCPDCAETEATKLRQRLIPVLRGFKALTMLTLTIDPSLFESGHAALRHLQTNRCLAKTMQDLRRHLAAPRLRYFAALEFQPGTGMPHYHVLVEAGYVDYEALKASWSKHRPAGAGSPPLAGPAFGFVDFKSTKGSVYGAAARAVSYVTKVPDAYPEWVLALGGSGGRVRLSRQSRGFWPPVNRAHSVRRPRKPRRPSGSSSRSYAERIRDCGQGSQALLVWNGDRSTPTGAEARRRWLGELDLSLSEREAVQAHCGHGGGSTLEAASIDDLVDSLSAIVGRRVRRLRR